MTNAKQPSHRAYYVAGEDDKAFWHEIGAAWPHGDGNGFNLRLVLMPPAGATITVRKVDADVKTDESGA